MWDAAFTAWDAAFTAWDAGGSLGQIESFVHFLESGGGLGGGAPGSPIAMGETPLPLKVQGGTVGWKNSQPGLGTVSIHKCMDASSLRCRKLAKKGRRGSR